MAPQLCLLFIAAICIIAKAAFVPPAEWCLPNAHLKELSGCIAMANKEDECAAKRTHEEQLDCYCTQAMLTSLYE